jgi:hypothetical protein
MKLWHASFMKTGQSSTVIMRDTHRHTDIFHCYSYNSHQARTRRAWQPDRHVGWEHLEKSVCLDWRDGWRIILKLISDLRLSGRYGVQLIIYISISQFVSRPDNRLSGMRSSAIFLVLSRQMLGICLFLPDRFQLLIQWSSYHWTLHILSYSQHH